ncbi:MAG: cell envelope integrity protein CreD [Epsilonproteobacteria bacterium]|nr:MAG: cell envelope integrity protein CreD [Campylobacterota bacterium]
MEYIVVLIGILILLSIFIGIVILGKWVYKKVLTQFASSNKEINTFEQKENSMINKSNELGIRFLIIGIIAIIMFIPLGSVSSIVEERNSLYTKVLHNIASQWGNPQIVTGPALIVPITEQYTITEKTKDANGNEKIHNKVVSKNKNVVILPKKLTKNIYLNEHYRYRSIYKSLVYEADMRISGAFSLPNFAKLSDNLHTVRYDKAFVVMGLSDTKAIQNVSELSFNENLYAFEPSTVIKIQGIKSGFHAPIEVNKAQNKYDFNFKLKTKGSSYIRFSAFGEQTDITLKSSWKHPSFQGAILPTTRNITKDGFEATWKIPSLARNFPQSWILEEHVYNVSQLLTGVDLYEPVFLYSLVSRSIKYGVLFIVLTFLTFLIFELTQNSKLHYVQYGLIGLSLGLFFLTLLSLSEHMLFLYAYIISSSITLISISIYTWFNNKDIKQSLSILTMLIALYAILYSLLQLEDYALLMGTSLLLVILFVLMWITRNLKVVK